ncbi:acyltransferase [Nguyenibacter vanlangensis]|uniref:Acyltransferase n=1 Tax=Nguyenibacter vanlangensis TaxID=1216886 RepID=A0ABZ3CZH4_9PROT
MARRLFHTLDGLRGLAAVAVVLVHMGKVSFPTIWYPAGGYLAVDLFFGLSGFVLAEAYAARLDAGLSLAAFMQKRIVRLWPLYALGLGLGAAAAALRIASHHAPPSALAPFLPALFYCPWFGSDGVLYPLNFPAWSLFYELLANIVMAAAWRRLDNRTLIGLVCLSALGLVVSARLLGSLNAGMIWSWAPAALARVGFSFFLGILLWRAGPRLLNVSVPPNVSAWVPMGLLALALAVDTHHIPRPLLDLSEVFFLLPAIIWLGASTRPTGASLMMFEALGGASYALYAVHAPILGLVAAFLNSGLHIPPNTASPWLCLAILAGLVLLAWSLNRLDVAFRARLDAPARWVTQRAARAQPADEAIRG